MCQNGLTHASAPWQEGIFHLNFESPNISSHTVAQLHDARLKRWHQSGEVLQTTENLRSWINAAGLVHFAPQPQILAPAPTFVEAVLGTPTSEPTLQQINVARGLLARLIADGVAVPLNLMGAQVTPGDTPDFVASAAVFSYVFTLRGDKAWKQPPAASGPIKVSNLALAAYEAISSKGPLSAYDLATQLGKEVTEAACLRSLNELWTHLRVIPLIPPDGRATTWELISSRFSKQIKAGANAGIPSAVSALISLYLGQTMAASEDEIESFLSPLAPRSRIRDVAHTLLNARQLDTVAIEGKTLLHIAGEAPSLTSAEPDLQKPEGKMDTAAVQEDHAREDGSRITKYIPRPRKVGTGYLAKGKPAAGKPSFRGGSEGFKPRTGARDDRERRPFRKPSGKESERRFDRPWEEDRPNRPLKRTGESRPQSRPPREGGWQKSARGEFRGGPRPQHRDESRPERPPRPQGKYRDQKGAYPDRGPHWRGEDKGFQRREKRPRADQDQGKSRGEGLDGQSRPQFRRFDAPKYESRRQRPRPAEDRAQGRERRDKFDRKPQRRESGFEGHPIRREGEFERRPPRREGGFEGRSPRREGTPDSRRPRRDGDFSPRPGQKQSGKRPFGKSNFGGASKRPSGKSANPPGKKKPFRKKPSDRTFKPKRDESAKPRRDESA